MLYVIKEAFSLTAATEVVLCHEHRMMLVLILYQGSLVFPGSWHLIQRTRKVHINLK